MNLYPAVLVIAALAFVITVVVSAFLGERLFAILAVKSPEIAKRIKHPLFVWGETKEQNAFEKLVFSGDLERGSDPQVALIAKRLRRLRMAQGLIVILALISLLLFVW